MPSLTCSTNLHYGWGPVEAYKRHGAEQCSILYHIVDFLSAFRFFLLNEEGSGISSNSSAVFSFPQPATQQKEGVIQKCKNRYPHPFNARRSRRSAARIALRLHHSSDTPTTITDNTIRMQYRLCRWFNSLRQMHHTDVLDAHTLAVLYPHPEILPRGITDCLISAVVLPGIVLSSSSRVVRRDREKNKI
jgi:hypothetical protein